VGQVLVVPVPAALVEPLRTYTVTPSTVVDGNVCATQDAISTEALDPLSAGLPPKQSPAMK
jgi:hypothetical protein